MRMSKKALSLMLLFAVMLQTIACGESDVDDPVRNSDTTETALTTEEIPEYIKPDVDYGGRTVTLTGYDYDGAWTILDYNMALEEENGDVINDAIVQRNRAVEEELNVNIELVSLGVGDRGSAAVLEKYILAQEDVITFGTQMATGLKNLITTEGMLVDLNDVPTLDLSHSWWNQHANAEYSLYGKQLAAVGDVNLFNLGAPVVVYFSQDVINNNKLNNPYQLVYDGKWTLDKMIEMSAAVARDINGNTEIDTEDYFGFAGETDTIIYAAYASDIKLSRRNTAGEIQLSLNTERTVNLAEKLVPFLRDKSVTIYNGSWSSQFSSVFTDFMMPKLMINELLFFSNQLLVSLNLRAMESDFGILPFPKYDEAQKDYISFGNGSFTDHVIVPSTNTDLEMTGHLLEAMGYYAQQYITPAFIDVSVKGKGARDEDSVNMVNIILENQVFDIGYIFNWGTMRSTLSNTVLNNDPSFASQWASAESKINTALEETIAMLKGE